MSSWRIACATTAEACASRLSAPASIRLSSVPTYHCNMLQFPLVGGQRPRTLRRESQRRLLYRERAIRRRHIPDGYTSLVAGHLTSFRAKLAVGTP